MRINLVGVDNTDGGKKKKINNSLSESFCVGIDFWSMSYSGLQLVKTGFPMYEGRGVRGSRYSRHR